MLLNSGAEAVENAIKIAKCAIGRNGILCFDNALSPGQKKSFIRQSKNILPNGLTP